MQGRLIAVEQHEPRGPQRFHLSGELGPDGPAGAGDHDDLATHVVGDLGDVGLDLSPTEEVGDVELAERLELDPAGDHLPDGRHDDEAQARIRAAVRQPLDELRARLADREHDDLGTGLPSDVDDVLAPAQHPVTEHPQEPLAGVVVDEPDDGVRGFLRRVDEPRDLVPGVTSAIDERGEGLGAVALTASVGHRAEHPATSRHEEEGQRGHGEREAAGEDGLGDEEDPAEDQGDPGHEASERRHLVEAADPAAAQVEVEPEAADHLEDDRRDGVGDRGVPHPLGERQVEPDEEEREERERPGQRVPRHHDGALEVDRRPGHRAPPLEDTWTDPHPNDKGGSRGRGSEIWPPVGS